MTDMKGNGDNDRALLKIRIEYWSKRLDHTLTHTQTSSRLIYLVDGAVLAFVYFVIRAFGGTRPVVGFASLPMLFLVGLNLMHAFLIKSQRLWYSNIDKKLRDELRLTPVSGADGKRVWWRSTHGIYQAMHWWIAAFLFLMASAMFAYGLGSFPDLPIRGIGASEAEETASRPLQPTSGAESVEPVESHRSAARDGAARR